MRVFFAVILAASLPLTPQSRTGRPMAIDDLIGAIRVADPQLSPDGSQVLFVRTATDLKSGERNADIWSVPADGSASAKEFIGGPKSENTPRFSPRRPLCRFHLHARWRAASLFDRREESERPSDHQSVHGGPTAARFAPNGSRIAVVSDVYPECSDEACNKRLSEETDKNPVKVHRLTRLLYRHWDEWRENVRHHIFVAEVQGRQAIDVTPGDFDSPPGQQEDGALAFSPDSREIAFASNREGGDREAWTTNHDIWTVSTAGGAVRKVTTNPASDLQPQYLPRRPHVVRSRAAAARIRVGSLVP